MRTLKPRSVYIGAVGLALVALTVGGVHGMSVQPAVARAVPAKIRLVRPGALVVAPRGRLYIADSGRNQILQLLPGGGFIVVAGNGKAGFSGDGGRAVHAELDQPGGMVIAPNGTLYFADTGNNRIRAIAPDGIISTIAGNGKYGWVRNGAPARAATLLSPSSVAIGPERRLYIASAGDNQVVRLETNRTLTQIAGNRRYAGVYGVGHRAVEASPDGPSGLAFDRAGNLFIAGFNTKTLLMITPGGRMVLPIGLDGFYPRGAGGLVTGPNGHVIAMNGQSIVRLGTGGARIILDLSQRRIDDITGFLPNGLAVAPDGTIFTDTFAGNGYTSKTAVLKISPGGHIQVLWKSL